MFSRKRALIKYIIKTPEKYLNSNIQVSGWVNSIRIQGAKSLGFLVLNDGSCLDSLQIILNSTKEEDTKFDNIFNRGTKGVSVTVVGKLIKSPAKGQDFELVANTVKIHGDVDAKEYPIAKKKLTLEHIRKFPHLRIKTNTMGSIARIRNECSRATHNFFQEKDFKYVHTPIISSNDCEGAGETFNILHKNDIGKNDEDTFFGQKVNLTVSGQLQGETYALGLGDIYTFGPTFRAENSNTSRHLSEFWMIEPEMCFIDLVDIIDLAEDYIKYCIQNVLLKCYDEVSFLNKQYQPDLISNLRKIVNTSFTRYTYTQVIDILLKEIEEHRAIVRDNSIHKKKFKKRNRGKHIFEKPIYWGCDLASEHEKYMTDIIIKGPLVVTDYPKEIKSFYMKENIDGKTVQAMDILVPSIGEIIGGSMREDNYQILKDKMDNKGLSIDWYLDLRKYGTTPHGGFGLGFERLVMLVTGMSNIRDVIPYPRYPKHCIC